MIAELIRIADIERLTGRESHRQRPVHWFIDIDQNGKVLGFSPTTRVVEHKKEETVERRGKIFKVSANYHMQWKNNKVQSVCTNDSNWLPDFLYGPPNEIFPAGVGGTYICTYKKIREAIRKNGKKHSDRNRLYKLRLWRRLILAAQHDNPRNPVIRAVANFMRSPCKFSDLPGGRDEKLLKAFDDGKEIVSFRINGQIAVSDSELQKWWEQRVGKQRKEVVGHLNDGMDAYGANPGAITEYFPSVFGGVPFASFDKAPFVSYGLGSQTATFRLDTAEKTAAGLNYLLSNHSMHLQLGDETTVFWAINRNSQNPIAADFFQLLEQPDPLAVRDYIKGVWGSRALPIAAADFHVAILLKGTGRFSVRSWHTDTLENADKNLRRYFDAIQLPVDVDKPPVLRDLAWTTIARIKGQKATPAPAVFNVLFETAWRGTPLPFNIFAAAIERQRIELASGDPSDYDFETRLRARIALIQLYFTTTSPDFKKENIMNSKDTAILCGRLLALLDEIHAEAHNGKSASSPANRVYGAASATPALVFPRLCQLARYHLAKMNAGMAHKYEFGVPKDRRDDEAQEDFEGLAAIVARLKEASGGNFPRMLSLDDQGRFALGFYYERNRKWPNYKTDDGKNKEGK